MATEWKNRNNEMYKSDWYDLHLMKYVKIIEHPRHSKEKSLKYTELLLQWYENWSGWMEEQD